MRLGLIGLVVIWSTGNLMAAKPYEPVKSNILKESWRWTELEALAPYTVRQVDEAPDGTLWFAVHGGIVKFDGYTATPFMFKEAGIEDANSVAIKVASNGSIHVSTNKFHGRFRDGEWKIFPQLARHSSSGSAIAESEDGRIWVASWMGTDSLGVSQIIGDEVKRLGPEFGAVKELAIDHRNQLWVSDEAAREIRRYELDLASGEVRKGPLVIPTPTGAKFLTTEFHEGRSGRMWIAANSDGNALRWVERDEVTTVRPNWGMISPGTRLITELSDGQIWVAAARVLAHYQAGSWSEERMDENANWFTFLHNLNDEILITGGFTDKVYAFDISPSRWETYVELNYGGTQTDGTAWFLSEDKRVVRWDPDSDSWTSFGQEDGLISHPNAILIATDDKVWVSGAHQDYAAVGWQEGERWEIDSHPNFGGMIGHTSAYESRDHSLHFGLTIEALNSGEGFGGIVRYWSENGTFEYEYLKPPEYPRHVFGIVQTKKNAWWYGGRRLMRKLPDQPLETFSESLGFAVDNVVLDSKETLWVGDWRTGVSHLVDGIWETFAVSEGRTRNRLVSLFAEDDAPGIWAATTEGLSRFDGDSWSRHTRFPELHLQREGGQLLGAPDGSLWINSAPRSWHLNQPTSRAEESVLFQTIRYTKDDFPPETRITAFDSTMPELGKAYFKWSGVDAWSRTWSGDLTYSFRVDDDPWSPFKNTEQISLLSPAPGAHRLEVRARDADWNIDPTPAGVDFSVTPLLWKRPWFLVTTAAILILIVTLALLLVRMRVRHILALEEFKIDFFTNISHELRTPLSVILGPLERILKRDPSPEIKTEVDMAFRNAQKMQGLVNQLLEFRKVELGKLKFEPIRSDIVAFLKDAIYAQASLWEKKHQQFRLTCAAPNFIGEYDPGKLQHIVGNLLSNAIKYTPEGGEIDIEISFASEGGERRGGPSVGIENLNSSLKLIVLDTGIGIGKRRQELIFKPFYRAQDSDREHEGSGIGLAYTSELVNLWGGKLSVESPIEGRGTNLGSRFTVILPLADSDLKEESGNFDSQVVTPFGEEDELDHEIVDRDRPLLLVVEDNSDVRDYLKSELSPYYEVALAINGFDGIEQATTRMPDAVITDLMMPEIDGLELCSRLKTKQETCHIPILMLTARGSDEYRLKGIEHGADDHFSKPVNMELLRARIESLLESREILRKRFIRQIVVQPRDITVTPVDEELLTKAIELVERNMRDEAFDVEAFANQMGMARASLYRKLGAIVGQTPFKFIRSIRLKRAAQLLKTGSVNVSEAIDLVGITGNSYFAKIFRNEFGILPSEYREKHMTEMEQK